MSDTNSFDIGATYNSDYEVARRLRQLSVIPELGGDPTAALTLAASPTSDQEMIEGAYGALTEAEWAMRSAWLADQDEAYQRAWWRSRATPVEQRALTDNGYQPPEMPEGPRPHDDGSDDDEGGFLRSITNVTEDIDDAILGAGKGILRGMTIAGDTIAGRPGRTKEALEADQQFANDQIRAANAIANLRAQGFDISPEQEQQLAYDWWSRKGTTYKTLEVINFRNPLDSSLDTSRDFGIPVENPGVALDPALADAFGQEVARLEGTDRYNPSTAAAWSRVATGNDWFRPTAQVQALDAVGGDWQRFEIAYELAKGTSVVDLLADRGITEDSPEFVDNYDNLMGLQAEEGMVRAIETLIGGQYSVGRGYAEAAHLRPGTRSFDVVSGAADATMVLTLDPTLFAGKVNLGRRLAMHGILGGINSGEGLMRVSRVAEALQDGRRALPTAAGITQGIRNREHLARMARGVGRVVTFDDDTLAALRVLDDPSRQRALAERFADAGLDGAGPLLTPDGEASEWFTRNYDEVLDVLARTEDELAATASTSRGQHLFDLADELAVVNSQIGSGATVVELGAGSTRAGLLRRAQLRAARQQYDTLDRISRAFREFEENPLAFEELTREMPYINRALRSLFDYDEVLRNTTGRGIQTADDIYAYLRDVNTGMKALSMGAFGTSTTPNMLEMPHRGGIRTFGRRAMRSGESFQELAMAGRRGEGRLAQALHIEGTKLARAVGLPAEVAGRFMFAFTHRAPSSGILNLEDVDEVKRFIDMAALSGMSLAERKSYFGRYLTAGLGDRGSLGAQYGVIREYMADLFERAGVYNDPILHDWANDMLTRAEGSWKRYSMNDNDIVIRNGHKVRVPVLVDAEWSNRMMIPYFGEILGSAGRSRVMARVWGGPNRRLGLTGSTANAFMSKVWSPMMVMKLGFIPRAAGEEALAWFARIGGRQALDTWLVAAIESGNYGPAGTVVKWVGDVAGWATRKRGGLAPRVPADAFKTVPREAFSFVEMAKYQTRRQWMEDAILSSGIVDSPYVLEGADLSEYISKMDGIRFWANWHMGRMAKWNRRLLAQSGIVDRQLLQAGAQTSRWAQQAYRMKSTDLSPESMLWSELAEVVWQADDPVGLLMFRHPSIQRAFAEGIDGRHMDAHSDQGDRIKSIRSIAVGNGRQRSATYEERMLHYATDGTMMTFDMRPSGMGQARDIFANLAAADTYAMRGSDLVTSAGIKAANGYIPEDKLYEIAHALNMTTLDLTPEPEYWSGLLDRWAEVKAERAALQEAGKPLKALRDEVEGPVVEMLESVDVVARARWDDIITRELFVYDEIPRVPKRPAPNDEIWNYVEDQKHLDALRSVGLIGTADDGATSSWDEVAAAFARTDDGITEDEAMSRFIDMANRYLVGHDLYRRGREPRYGTLRDLLDYDNYAEEAYDEYKAMTDVFSDLDFVGPRRRVAARRKTVDHVGEQLGELAVDTRPPPVAPERQILDKLNVLRGKVQGLDPERRRQLEALVTGRGDEGGMGVIDRVANEDEMPGWLLRRYLDAPERSEAWLLYRSAAAHEGMGETVKSVLELPAGIQRLMFTSDELWTGTEPELRRRLFAAMRGELDTDEGNWFWRDSDRSRASMNDHPVTAPPTAATRSYYNVMVNRDSLDELAALMREEGGVGQVYRMVRPYLDDRGRAWLRNALAEWDVQNQYMLAADAKASGVGVIPFTRLATTDDKLASQLVDAFNRVRRETGRANNTVLGTVRVVDADLMSDSLRRAVINDVGEDTVRLGSPLVRTSQPLVRDIKRINSDGELVDEGGHLVVTMFEPDAKDEAVEVMVNDLMDLLFVDGDWVHEISVPLANKTFSVRDIEMLPGDRLPHYLYGPRYRPMQTKVWDQIVSYGWDTVIGGAMSALIRRPMFTHKFRQGLLAGAPVVDAMRQTTVHTAGRSALQKVMGIDLDAMKNAWYAYSPRGTSRETIEDGADLFRHLEFLEVPAKVKYVDAPDEWDDVVRLLQAEEKIDETWATIGATRAVADIVPYLDDNRIRSFFSNYGRNVLPFWFAQEQFYKRWVRSAAHSPEAIRRAQLIAHGFTQAYFVEENERGEKVVAIPFSESATRMFSNTLPFKLLFGEAPSVPVSTPLTMQVQYMLPGIGAGTTEAPSLGPLVTLPLNAAAGKWKWLAPAIDPLLGERGVGRSPVEQLVPSWALKMMTPFIGTEDMTGRLTSTTIGAMQMMEAESLRLLEESEAERAAGNTDKADELYERHLQLAIPDTNDPADQQRYIDEVDAWARSLMVMQGAFGFVSPGGATIEWPDEMNGDLREMIGVLGPDQGTARWLAMNPNAGPYTVFRTTNEAKGTSVPPTQRSLDWMLENREWMESFSLAAPWVMPQNDSNDPFEQRAWDEMVARGLRSYKTPNEWVEAYHYAAAAPAYFDMQDQAAATDALLGDADPEARRVFEAYVQSEAQRYRTMHPSFAAQLTGEARERRGQLIEQLELALEDPGRPFIEHEAEMREMLGAYRSFEEAMTLLSGDQSQQGGELRNRVRSAFSQWGEQYIIDHPAVYNLWRSVIERAAEVREDRVVRELIPASYRADVEAQRQGVEGMIYGD